MNELLLSELLLSALLLNELWDKGVSWHDVLELGVGLGMYGADRSGRGTRGVPSLVSRVVTPTCRLLPVVENLFQDLKPADVVRS